MPRFMVQIDGSTSQQLTYPPCLVPSWHCPPPQTRVGYLKSYHNMGTARVSCISGCQCQDLVVDAWHTSRTSQTHLVKLPITQAADCRVQIQVLNTTSSGGLQSTSNQVAIHGSLWPCRTHALPRALLPAALLLFSAAGRQR